MTQAGGPYNRIRKIDKEEIKALKLFFPIFYLTYLGYDVIFNRFYLGGSSILGGLGWVFPILIVLLLPFSFYLHKKGYLYSIKYCYFIGFNLLDLFNTMVLYSYIDDDFKSGAFAEILFAFSTPIFINKNYYWVVTIGLILKYIIIGFVTQTLNVINPIILIIIISTLTFIILSRIFSYLKSLTEVYEEMNHKEKLASIGQIATGIVHEIRNPLTSLKGFIQLQQEMPEQVQKYSHIMKSEIERISSIVDDLMIIGKPKPYLLEKVDLKEIVDYGLFISEQLVGEKTIVFHKEYSVGPTVIFGDEKQLKQLVINLIKNSIESMGNEGAITVCVDSLNDKSVMFSITDEGCGIPEENIGKLFEPFFTTKKGGTGIGLMVTNQIVKDHNGRINIESRINKGTKITIKFPAL
ncbi:ATP-binding protein [Bacillus sp. EB01]|uniref:ATP-binding protein n=1 Tax=Bacillus sp. EB01 TaxID=1347086 RepID=UPI0005C54ABC|nr:ATP-binding protein [Bacillus sp. EB01]